MMKRGLVTVLVAAMLVTSINPVNAVYAAEPETVQAEADQNAAETAEQEVTEQPAAGDETVTGQEKGNQAQPEEGREGGGAGTDQGVSDDDTAGGQNEADESAQNEAADPADADAEADQGVSDDDTAGGQDAPADDKEIGQADAEEPGQEEAADQADEETAEEPAQDVEEQISFEEELFGDSYGTGTLQGAGTEQDPYRIYNLDDLLLWRTQMSYSSADYPKYAILQADITMNSSLDNNELVMWNRTSAVTIFYGVFDGKGYTIKNLYMSRPDATGTDPLGLADKNAGVIKNLVIENAKIEYGTNIERLSNASSVGVFAGINVNGSSGGGSIENCTLKGTVSLSGKLCYVGGFVGSLNSGSVTGCKNHAADFAVETVYYDYHNTGGIAGKMSGTTSIADCQTGAEDGTSVIRGAIGSVGGIVGSASKKVRITNCQNYAKIVGTLDNILGGIAASSSEGGSLDNCVNYGRLEGPRGSSIGGIVCMCSAGSVSNCINKGALSGGSAAGIVCRAGSGSSITKCANFGKLIHAQTMGSTVQIGGIAATLSGSTIENCYNCGKMEDAAGDLYSGQFGGIAACINPSKDETAISKCYNVGALIDDSSFTKKGSGGIVGAVTKESYATGAVTLTDCYADSVILAQDATDEVDVSKCYQKASAALQDQSTYTGWDFEDTWTMGTDVYKYPVLKGMAEPESMPEAPGSSADTPGTPDTPGGSEEIVKSSYTITLDGRNGAVPATVSVEAGKKLQKPDQPGRAGYIFKGWYLEDSCINLWDFENGTVWSDITLYAGWEAEDDLSSAPASDQIANGDAAKLWMAKIGTYTYTGAAIKPSVPVYYGTRKLRAGTDYTIKYTNNTKAGTANVKVTGKGIFKSGTALEASFTIEKRSIADSTVVKTFTNAYAVNTKSTKNPSLVFSAKYGKKTLSKKNDYTIKVYSADGSSEVTDWHGAGEYTLKAEGKGNYTGIYTAKFKVVEGTPVSKLKVSKIKAQKYDDGKALTPKPEIKSGKTVLTEGTDYSLTYKNNTEIGTASLIIMGKGSYVGTREVNFAITGLPLSKAKFTGWKSSMEYSGKEQEQYVTLTYGSGANKVQLYDNDNLPEGYTGVGDYTVVSYENNKYVGKATVTYKGMGKYSGTLKKTFKITPHDIKYWGTGCIETTGNIETGEGFDVYLTDSRLGKLLTSGVDYKFTRKKSKNTVTVTVTGKGNYKGKIVKKYTVSSEPVKLGFKPDDFKIAGLPATEVKSVKQISDLVGAISGYNENGYGYYLKGGDKDYRYYDNIKKLKDGDICSLTYKGGSFISYDRDGDLSIMPVSPNQKGEPDLESKVPDVQIPAGYDSGDTIDALKDIIAAAPKDEKGTAVCTTEYGRVKVSSQKYGIEGYTVHYRCLTIVFEAYDDFCVYVHYDEDTSRILYCTLDKKSDYSNDK